MAQRLDAMMRLAPVSAPSPSHVEKPGGNIGCPTRLAGGAMPRVHKADLPDWMAGGAEQPQVAQARRARAA